MMRYSYDRRATSATPKLDEIAKSNFEPKLTQMVNRASKAADKAEDTAKKRGDLKPMVDEAVKAAYSMLDLLRPALQHGPRELEAIGNANFETARQARQLVQGLQNLDRKHYGPLASGAHRELLPSETVKAIHDLAMEMSYVKTFYKQYKDAYGR